MKKRELNALGLSTCSFFMSRNNDINGYWGMGVLCNLARLKGISKMSFQLKLGSCIQIFGCELTDSDKYCNKIFEMGVDQMEGRIEFLLDGRYGHEWDKYLCAIAISVRQDDRMGLAMKHFHCWPHDPKREARRRISNYPKI